MTSHSLRVPLIFVSCLLSALSTRAAQPAPRTFRHPQGLFTVPVPDGWSIQPGGVIFRFQKLDFQVKIVVQATPDHLEFGRIWTQRALDGLREIRRVPGGDLHWGGAESGRYDLYGGLSPDGESMKIEVVSATDGIHSYILILSAPRRTWETLNQDWRSFVYDFTLCRLPGSSCPGAVPPTPDATPAPPSPATTAAPAIPSARTAGAETLFRDPRQRFHLRVPPGWTASATAEGAVVSRSGAYVNILAFDSRQPNRAIVESLTSQISRQWRNFQEIQGGESSLAGLPADFALSTGTNPKGVPALLKVVAVADTQRSYTLLMSVPQAEFEALRSDLDAIESSFSLGAMPATHSSIPVQTPPVSPVLQRPTPQPQPALPAPSRPAPVVRTPLPRTQPPQTQPPQTQPPQPQPAQPRPAPQPLQQQPAATSPAAPIPPSGTLKPYQCAAFTISLPDNWSRQTVSGSSLFYFTAANGLRARPGGVSLVTGLIAGFSPMAANDLPTATDILVQKLLQENPGTRLSSAQRRQTTVAGLPAESLLLEGQSLLSGEPEVSWLLTVRRPQGLFHLMLVCPRSEFPNLRSLFGRIATSLRFQ